MRAMSCPACRHENRDTAAFCESCGSSLARVCPSCGAEVRLAARFCDACGHGLADHEAAFEPPAPRSYIPNHLAEKILTERSALAGERKQVTVLFADVERSMDLAEAAGAERWRGVMEGLFAIWCEGVHRFEGTVYQFTGDGILALFGAPIAHEDHALRACHSALHLIDSLARHGADLKRREGIDLSVRIGLNSGEVVVGTIGDDLQMEYSAIGHTVGLAQRMESLAEPGKAYLSEHTAALVSGYFRLRELGAFEVKGVRAPIRVHALEGTEAAKTALDVARARGLSPFVGREPQLAVLEAALEGALRGNGQVVGLIGDAGVGKSRLAFEFAERCRARAIPVYEGHAMAHAKTIAFLPVLEMLRGYFGVAERDPEDVAREKVTSALQSLDRAFERDLPLLLDFLGVPGSERPVSHMDPAARQERLLGIVKRLVRARSRREPAVSLIEDLHWIDPASEPFVEALVEAVPTTRTLVLATLRPGYDADWMRRSYYQQLPLPPLDPQATGALLSELLGSDPSLDGLAELVRERTGGNAFFIEEVVKGLVESKSLAGERSAYRLLRSIDELTVPATVQAVLGGRIDRLPEQAKTALQTAAVIGKRFPAAVLGKLSALTEAELQRALGTLVAAEFVYEELPAPEAEYAFNHPLTQEVAYGSQLSSHRARVHAAVAEALADLYAERLDERAALIAHHWEAAGEPLEAARWNRRAADWTSRNNPGEAMRNWRKVRALARAAPESGETVELGQAARIWILELGWRLGMSTEEAEAVFAEGKAVAERSDDRASLAMLLTPYAIVVGRSAGLERWVELNFESCRLADESGVLEARLWGRGGLVYALYLSGRLAEGLAVAEEGIELTGGDVTIRAGRTAGDPSALAYFTFLGAFFLAQTGRLGDAATAVEQTILIAREQEDVETLCWARIGGLWLARSAGDPRLALEHAREALEIAEAIGGDFNLVLSYCNLGLAYLLNGEWSEAVAACERARAIAGERGAGLEYLPLVLACLAEAHLGGGDESSALRTAEEAVAFARAARLRLWEVIAALALGRVLLRSVGARECGEAEVVLTGALALAGEIGARSEEPPIRVELAELARLRGDEAARRRELQEAQQLFSEIGAAARAEQVARQLETMAPVSGG